MEINPAANTDSMNAGSVTPAMSIPDSGTNPDKIETAASQNSQTETQAFAQRLKEQRARDREAWEREAQAKLDEVVKYGWGEQGIESYDSFMTRRKAAEFQQTYTEDPLKAIRDATRQELDEHPVIKEYREKNAALAYENEAAVFAKQLPEANVKSGADLRELVDSDPAVSKLVKELGISPTAAYWQAHGAEIAQKRAIAAEQEAVKKLQANAAASPGSVSAPAETPITFTDEQLRNLDRKRLLTDDAYYKAATEALRRKKK